VRCSVCYKNYQAAVIGKTTRPPAIATEEGTPLFSQTLGKHLASSMHASAVNAQKVKTLQDINREQVVPVRKMFAQRTEAIGEDIGEKLIEIYANAKRGSSGWSWPARHVSHQTAQQFQPNEVHVPYVPKAGSLTYVNQTMQNELLESIVKPELPMIKRHIKSCLAVSLSVDGSVDRKQVDNKHCMLKIVDATGSEYTIFLGFSESEKRGTDGYVEAVKRACGKVIDWTRLTS
jgi:hypothetical protein